MARPIVHGARQMGRQLDVGGPYRAAAMKNRIEPRTRRQLSKMERRLRAAPFEAVRADLLARMARKELVCQMAEAHLIANPDEGVSRWLGVLWNSLRRDAETLALLERCHPVRDEGTSGVLMIPAAPISALEWESIASAQQAASRAYQTQLTNQAVTVTVEAVEPLATERDGDATDEAQAAPEGDAAPTAEPEAQEHQPGAPDAPEPRHGRRRGRM
jgi:hypothetical protein